MARGSKAVVIVFVLILGCFSIRNFIRLTTPVLVNSEENLCKKTKSKSDIDWQEQSECALKKRGVSPRRIDTVRKRMAWAMEPFVSKKLKDEKKKYQIVGNHYLKL